LFNCADITKVKKVLSQEPKINIDEGLKLIVNWYKRLWEGENGNIK